jgi:hypothetical protein
MPIVKSFIKETLVDSFRKVSRIIIKIDQLSVVQHRRGHSRGRRASVKISLPWSANHWLQKKTASTGSVFICNTLKIVVIVGSATA